MHGHEHGRGIDAVAVIIYSVDVVVFMIQLVPVREPLVVAIGGARKLALGSNLRPPFDAFLLIFLEFFNKFMEVVRFKI